MELKPCPFCGSSRIELTIMCGAFYVECTECKSRGKRDIDRQEAIDAWNRRPGPEKSKVKTVPLSSLKDTDYVWILTGRCGIYKPVWVARRDFPDWNVTAFVCEIDTPVISYDTFDQRIFDLVDDSEYQFYIGNGEGEYPYYSPETVKQMYDILMAGIREKGQFVKPTDIQVVKD